MHQTVKNDSPRPINIKSTFPEWRNKFRCQSRRNIKNYAFKKERNFIENAKLDHHARSKYWMSIFSTD